MMVICIKGTKNDLRRSWRITVLTGAVIYNFKTNCRIRLAAVPIKGAIVQSINMISNNNLHKTMVITRKEANKLVRISQYQINLNIQSLQVNKVQKFKGAVQSRKFQIIIKMLPK